MGQMQKCSCGGFLWGKFFGSGLEKKGEPVSIKVSQKLVMGDMNSTELE
jgi:hypothetical protein